MDRLNTPPAELEFVDWGLIDYQESLQQQLEMVEHVAAHQLPGYLVFCKHPPIVTLGRATKDGDVFAWQGAVQEISRGGRATYHGPSQAVVYPILNLNYARKNRPSRDIGGYLRALEDAIVRALKSYNVPAAGRSFQKKDVTSDESEETGVWVGNKKIASLGLAVKKWVSFHGAAINLHHDESAFQGLRPCGFSSETMISLEMLLARKIDEDEFKRILKHELDGSL